MNGQTVLPDPTLDLHWDDFRGPIHSFFDANTAKHPDRVCVIGTLVYSPVHNDAPLIQPSFRDRDKSCPTTRIHLYSNMPRLKHPGKSFDKKWHSKGRCGHGTLTYITTSVFN
jgi:hypothetical protein